MAKPNILRIFSGVYRITNIANGLIYIGCSREIRARFRRHKTALRNGTHPSKRMKEDFAKYGMEVFKLEMLESISEPGVDLAEVEQRWIGKLHACDPDIGYNSDFKRSEETRKKMSESALKRPPEHYVKVAASLTGQEFTAERCANISAAQKSSERFQKAASERNAAKRTLTHDNVRRIRSMASRGATAIAKEYGVSRRVVRAILDGETYLEVA